MTRLSDLFKQGAGQEWKLLHVRHVLSSGNAAGTFTSGSYQTRPLNTVETNEISGASLSSNQITLPAGTYYFEGFADAYNVDTNKLKLYNVTDTADVIIGLVSYVSNVDQQPAVISGMFTLSSTKTLEVQHRCSTTRSSDGYGFNATYGDSEVYADFRFWRKDESRVLPVNAPLLHVEDQKTSGTQGGTATSGSWFTRTLNTVVTNEIPDASLSTNQITLPAGKYYVDISVPGYRNTQYNIRLRNITDSTNDLNGTSEYSVNTYNVANRSFMSGILEITEQKVFEVQHRCQTTQTGNGLGVSTGVVFTVDHEVYSVVKIWKLSS